MSSRFSVKFLVILLPLLLLASPLKAEEEEGYDNESPIEAPPPKRPAKKAKKFGQKRYFVAQDPDERRTDAGVFSVGFAVGGNFYMEPQTKNTTDSAGVTRQTVTGDYFKDFGFQGGVYFDYDYSQLTENVPLGIRGMLGYKYILNSTHVFAFDGVVRRMFNVSENVTAGIGMGGSAALWYRSDSAANAESESIFLPSFIATFGCEFNPFMVDFKWLINRFQSDNTITGVELYFGVRL